MRSISAAFTAFLLVAALAAPAALARPAHDVSVSATPIPSGQPTWPVDPQPIASPAPQPAPSDGFPWDVVGLVLIAGGIGVAAAVAAVRIRRRPHITA
jgi:hypothetical protein